MVRLAINLQKVADYSSLAIPTSTVAFAALGVFVSPLFHIATVPMVGVTLAHWYLKYVQTKHTTLTADRRIRAMVDLLTFGICFYSTKAPV